MLLLPQRRNCKINLILYSKIHYIDFSARGGKTNYAFQLLAMHKETIKWKEKTTPTDERLLQQKMNSE